jgi:fructose-1,6-bisphosphatase
MTKVPRGFSLILALALLATAAFLIPSALRPSEADNDSEFAAKAAGTYLVTRDPADGPSWILTIHADGNLSSILSIQFSEAAGPGSNAGFSDQQGAWKKAGGQ